MFWLCFEGPLNVFGSFKRDSNPTNKMSHYKPRKKAKGHQKMLSFKNDQKQVRNHFKEKKCCFLITAPKKHYKRQKKNRTLDLVVHPLRPHGILLDDGHGRIRKRYRKAGGEWRRAVGEVQGKGRWSGWEVLCLGCFCCFFCLMFVDVF